MRVHTVLHMPILVSGYLITFFLWMYNTKVTTKGTEIDIRYDIQQNVSRDQQEIRIDSLVVNTKAGFGSDKFYGSNVRCSCMKFVSGYLITVCERVEKYSRRCKLKT